MDDISRRSRYRHASGFDPEVALEERGKSQSAAHHHSCGREARIAGIHIAEVNLALVGDGCPAQQQFIAVQQDYILATAGEGERRATTLKTATQDGNAHAGSSAADQARKGLWQTDSALSTHR